MRDKVTEWRSQNVQFLRNNVKLKGAVRLVLAQKFHYVENIEIKHTSKIIRRRRNMLKGILKYGINLNNIQSTISVAELRLNQYII